MLYLLRRWLRLLCPFRVIATAPGWAATHYATSYADALEWARCYPAADGITIYNRRNRFVAWRRPA